MMLNFFNINNMSNQLEKELELLKKFVEEPDKYVYTFSIKEKHKIRHMLTYNKSNIYGEQLKTIHRKIANAFEKNFFKKNINSFAYQKDIACKDALVNHLKSNYFIKIDVHHFFESITLDNFFRVYDDRFNTYWKNIITGCFYKQSLSIGFITSPILSNYFMSKFDEAITKYINKNKNLHYSRYCDDILISSEIKNDVELDMLYELIIKELDNLGLKINLKKLKKINLDFSSHNSLSFLGLNISKSDNINNKITISKNYILFLLYLIEKNNKYESKCKGLVDEINSRVAYLAYNSPVSFQKFQKKHINKFGVSYSFIPKRLNNRVNPVKIDELYNYSQYESDYYFNIHKNIQFNNSLIVKDGVELVSYKGKDEKVIIPPFIDSISSNAFSQNKIIKEIVLNDKVKLIDSYAFSGCTSLTKIVLPKSLRVIGTNAFSGCTSLKTINIPEKVKIINDNAFEFSGLEKIEISNELKEIKPFAFKDCFNLSIIKLPDSLETIGNNAFQNCKKLKSVRFSNKLLTIPEFCFSGCDVLNKFYNYNSILSIEPFAFENCNSLIKIYIPKNLVNIDHTAFNGCFRIEEINVDKNNNIYDSRNNCNAIVETKQNKLFIRCKNTKIEDGIEELAEGLFESSLFESINLPNSLKIIGENTFNNCYLLKNIKLPDGLLSIGAGAFKNCLSLKNIKIPKNIISIESSTFENCENLEKVEMPNIIENIGEKAFNNNFNLKEIVFPDNLKQIGYKAFSNCYLLKNIKIPKFVSIIKPYAFSGCSKNLETIEVDSNNTKYDSRNNCNAIIETIKNKIILGCKNTKIPNDIKIIGEFSFAYCNEILNITIPDTVQEIEDKAFIDCKKLICLDLNKTIKIGNESFYNCISLSTVNLPNSLVKMGKRCFGNCKSLKDAILPESLINYSIDIFESCDSIENVYIPHGVNKMISLPNTVKSLKINSKNKTFDCRENCNAVIETKTDTLLYAFENAFIPNNIKRIDCNAFSNSNIKSIEVPKSVNYIAIAAFSNCENLETVNFLDNNQIQLCNCVFKNCKKLKNIKLPQGLKKIPESIFENCTSLEKIEIPKTVKNISNLAFSGCSSLNTIKLPENIQTIPYLLFNNCSSLHTIELPVNVINIESSAFEGCTSLKTINIPKNVKSISDDAFKDCKNLKNIKLDPKNQTYKLILNKYIVNKKTNRLVFGNKDTQILNQIKIIGENYFANCQNIKEIVIPDNVVSIEQGAFSNCKKLTKVVLPKTIKSIKGKTFANCKNLKEIVIPDTINIIGEGAFSNCENLLKVVLPKSLSKIETSAFNNCKNLKEIVIPDTVNVIGEEAFSNCKNLIKVVLPKSLSKIETLAFNNCKNLKEIVIPDTVNVIGEEAFSNCKNLIKVILPKSLSKIENETFAYCSSLKKIYIGENINEISPSAFYGCSNSLEKIIVDKNNKYYDSNNNCNAIIDSVNNSLILGCKNTKIPNKVICIGENAFAFNKKIKEINISNNIEFIKGNAFYNSSLRKIVISKSVKSIAFNAFYGCKYLECIEVSKDNKIYDSRSNCNALIVTKINLLLVGTANTIIPNDVNAINSCVFNSLKNLKSIKIPKNVIYINEKSFYRCPNIESIKVDIGNPKYDSRENCNAIIETNKEQLLLGCKNTIIPDSVTRLGKYAFQDCKDLKSIKISKNIKNIAYTTFINCPNIQEIKVDKNNHIYDSRNNCNAIILTNSNNLILKCKTSHLPDEIKDFDKYNNFERDYFKKYNNSFIKSFNTILDVNDLPF